MKVAAVCCANGFGHSKRVIRILNHLVNRFPVESITFFYDARGFRAFDDWEEYVRLCEQCKVKIVDAWLPVRWNLNPDYYGDWLLNWHATMRGWDLGNFDFVLSDNLVEPLLYSNRAALCGSFLWHDVLFSVFPDHKIIDRYMFWCKGVLEATQPHVIANRYFVSPVLREQPNVHLVGLVHFSKARETARINHLPARVLIALGAAQAADGVADKLSRAVGGMHAAGMTVLAPLPLFETLRTRCPDIQPFDFWDNNLQTVDLAVIRGGLGTISDCIAAQVPMLYVDDRDPEIRFNQARLNQLGIGLPLDRFLSEDFETFTNPLMYRDMLLKIAGFDLNGHVEATDILAKLWGLHGGNKGSSAST